MMNVAVAHDLPDSRLLESKFFGNSFVTLSSLVSLNNLSSTVFRNLLCSSHDTCQDQALIVKTQKARPFCFVSLI